MADPAVWITGTGPDKQLNFRLPTGGKGDKGDKGDKGADGANVLPTDTAIANAINASGSATKTALSATIATALAANPSGVKAGDAWWNTTFAAPAAADTPVVTLNTASSITGTLTKPKRIGDVTTNGLDVEADAAFRYDGTPGGEHVTVDWVQATQTPEATYSLVPETVTSRNVSQIEFMVRTTGTSLAVRIVVNGKWLTLEAQRFTVTANTTYWLKLVFPSAAARTIRLEGAPQFGGALVPTGATLTRPAAPIQKRLVVIADSFGGGASTPPDGASRIETFPNFLAKLLEADSFINLGVGGTGWVATSTPFTSRLDEALALQPHMVFIVGSRNDDKVDITSDQIFTAVRDGVGLLNEVPVVYLAGPSQSPFTEENQAVKDGAVAAGRPFIDALTVITGALTGSDNVHPTFEGHKTLAKALYAGTDRLAADTAVASMSKLVPVLDLTANPVEGVQGQTSTLTATVTPAVSGQIKFRDGTTVIGTSQLVGGVATITTGALAFGAHPITAQLLPSSLSVKSVTGSLAYTAVPAAISDVILTGLLVEADARNLALADGAAISTLSYGRGSKTQDLVQATSANRPTFVAADTHGHPSIKAVPSQFLASAAWAAATTAGTPLTFYTVHRMASTGTGTAYVYRGMDGTAAPSMQHASAVSGYQVTAGATVTIAGQTGHTGWRVDALTYNNGQVRHWQNTINAPTTSTTVSTSSMVIGSLRLGSYGGGSSGYDNRISEVIAYEGVHTDEQVAQMIAYLADQWDVTLTGA